MRFIFPRRQNNVLNMARILPNWKKPSKNPLLGNNWHGPFLKNFIMPKVELKTDVQNVGQNIHEYSPKTKVAIATLVRIVRADVFA